MSQTTNSVPAQTADVGASNIGAMTARSGASLNQARIAIRNLDFYYGDNKALKAINLDLPGGR